MIDYKEIRYGNKLLYDYEGDIITVLGYSYSDGVFNDRSSIPIDPESLDPITITEEWLLKFGFKKEEAFDFGFSLKKVPKYVLNDFEILLSDDVFHYVRWVYDGGSGEELESVIELEYVHHLQNLFFELKRQELIESIKQ